MTPTLKAAIERANNYMDQSETEPLYTFDGWVEVPTADLRLILDALAERQWRPIETDPPPRDFTKFDVWGPVGPFRATDCWADADGRIMRMSDVSGMYYRIESATHWMPTPPPPEEEG